MRYLYIFLILMTSTLGLKAAARGTKSPTPDTLVLVSQIDQREFSIAEGDKLWIRTKTGEKIKGRLEDAEPGYLVIGGQKVLKAEVTEVRYYPPRVRKFRSAIYAIMGGIAVYNLVKIIIDFNETRSTVSGLGGSAFLLVLRVILIGILVIAYLLFAGFILGLIALIGALFGASTLASRKKFHLPRAYRIMVRKARSA